MNGKGIDLARLAQEDQEQKEDMERILDGRSTLEDPYAGTLGIGRVPTQAFQEAMQNRQAKRMIDMLPKLEDMEQVKSPSHYTSGMVETIYTIRDALGEEGFKAYCIGNTMKYVSRFRGKNGDEDLSKALVYLGWAMNGLPKPVNGKVPK